MDNNNFVGIGTAEKQNYEIGKKNPELKVLYVTSCVSAFVFHHNMLIFSQHVDNIRIKTEWDFHSINQ